MDNLQFSEALKILDGQFYNLLLHEERMQKTTLHFYGTKPRLMLTKSDMPENLRQGLVKCRVVYSDNVDAIEFLPYTMRRIGKIKLIEDNDIDYTYKSVDRSRLSQLLAQKDAADDILIVKNGLITDTSFSNVVFENQEGFCTPSACLLEGVKRKLLLQQGRIAEREIRASDIRNYSRMYFINAMIDLDDNLGVDIEDVIL